MIGCWVGCFGGVEHFLLFFFFPPQNVSSVSINKLSVLDAGMEQT